MAITATGFARGRAAFVVESLADRHLLAVMQTLDVYEQGARARAAAHLAVIARFAEGGGLDEIMGAAREAHARGCAEEAERIRALHHPHFQDHHLSAMLSIAVLVIHERDAALAAIGDIRAMLLRQDARSTIFREHTVEEAFRRMGRTTGPGSARIVTRAFSSQPFQPWDRRKLALQPGDRLLLYTGDLARSLRTDPLMAGTPAEAIQALQAGIGDEDGAAVVADLRARVSPP